MLNKNFANGVFDNDTYRTSSDFAYNPLNDDNIPEKVLSFYKSLPFNYYSDPEIVASGIKERNSVTIYIPNDKTGISIGENTEVLELGCGTGWMSNMMQYYYNCKVTGIDFNPVAIDFARKTSDLLNLSTEFRVDDIFQYHHKSLVDLVVSIGVLHHTQDCRLGLAKACGHLKDGGYVAIGLYNKYGRKPFLDFFQKMKANGESEDAMFKAYVDLDNRHTDSVAAKSWFYDQVLHPHETLHTLSEIVEVFENNNVKLKCTSINNFEPIVNVKDIYAQEKHLFDKGLKYINSGKYYTGFFIAIGQKVK